MMNPELYFAFVAASAILIIIPGPTVTLVVANSVAHGARHALMSVAGAQSAIALQLAVVALGMTSLIAVLATWFDWLRSAGVAYLIWLGIQRWRAAPVLGGDGPSPAASGKAMFWQGFVVTVTNPKVLFFYAAFFPQFIDPTRPLAAQLALLSVSFLLIALVLDGSYALLAGRVRHVLRGERGGRLANRVAGSILMGTGLWLALARRSG